MWNFLLGFMFARATGISRYVRAKVAEYSGFSSGSQDFFFYRASNEAQRSRQLWQLKKVPLVQVVSGVWKLDLAR
jgi:hypothetical protein